jgi:hypothetical protein
MAVLRCGWRDESTIARERGSAQDILRQRKQQYFFSNHVIKKRFRIVETLSAICTVSALRSIYVLYKILET